MEEALCELRAAPDGEGVQAAARVGEQSGAVVGDAAAPRDVEGLERRCAVLGEGLVGVRIRVRVRLGLGLGLELVDARARCEASRCVGRYA